MNIDILLSGHESCKPKNKAPSKQRPNVTARRALTSPACGTSDVNARCWSCVHAGTVLVASSSLRYPLSDVSRNSAAPAASSVHASSSSCRSVARVQGHIVICSDPSAPPGRSRPQCSIYPASRHAPHQIQHAIPGVRKISSKADARSHAAAAAAAACPPGMVRYLLAPLLLAWLPPPRRVRPSSGLPTWSVQIRPCSIPWAKPAVRVKRSGVILPAASA